MKTYTYTGNWVRVIDGNTLILNLDMGLHTAHIGPFQLKDVDAAPVSGVDKEVGLALKEKLEGILLKAGELTVETYKPDKHGRWLAELTYINTAGEVVNINSLMANPR